MTRLVRGGEVVDPKALPSERAITRLAREGITLPGKPTFEVPTLHDDLSSYNDDALMEVFIRFTSWADYLNTLAAAAMVDERAAETALEIIQARVLVGGWGGTAKDRVTVAKAERSMDPDVVKAREVLQERYGYRKLTEVLANNVERDAALVSRELTRRTSYHDTQQRAGKYGV